MSRPLVLGITGASGAAYATRLLEVLLQAGRTVHLSISPAGAAVLAHELKRSIDLRNFRLRDLLGDAGDSFAEQVRYYHYQDFMAPMASGSFPTDGMVVCPCSGGTLSGIVHAASNNLIQRAADVHVKERRKLILVPRETPLSVFQLENMHRAAQADIIVLPAMPGFYHQPRSLEDLIDFVVARICDQLGLDNSLMPRWGSPPPGEL